jgi:hypothetical protein
VGVYKSISNTGASKKESRIDIMRRVGEAEYEQASDADKLYVMRR